MGKQNVQAEKVYYIPKQNKSCELKLKFKMKF